MKTYSGYTSDEIQEMEVQGMCPSHILIAFMNDDFDGSDED